MIKLMRRITGKTQWALALLLCCLPSLNCPAGERRTPHPGPPEDDLAVYRKTNDQVGHELVKAEEFLVARGTVIVIRGLEFAPGSSALTPAHKIVLQQVFNSLEEITEDIVGDTNKTRVAEYKKMEFVIRGYGDASGSPETNLALGEERAQTVLQLLTVLGTPARRLKAEGLVAQGPTASNASAGNPQKARRVEFIRTR